MDNSSNDMVQFCNYVRDFVSKYKGRVSEGVLCDEELLVDLIKLDVKQKKASNVWMPSNPEGVFNLIKLSS